MKHIWLNDRLTTAEAAAIDCSDRGFLLGDGVFETMRLHDGTITRLDAHLGRLTEGAKLLQIPFLGEDRLRMALSNLVEANGLASGSLRLTLSRGTGPRGLLPPPSPRPTLLITQALPSPPLGPCRLHVSRYRRDGASPLSRIKHLNYLPQILSRLEADQAGYDDALLLSVDGVHVAEASASTDRAERRKTPHTCLQDGALAGMARARSSRRDFAARRASLWMRYATQALPGWSTAFR
ncbi:aminotransferase class IV [Asaia platycodi]|uniref:aminotransferase class IV n=1 Tax=Asaia platycodi TaxID=610243 RepID=UPI00068736E4|nr:aminotransferase class IV [Asaia platycodi]